MMKRFLIVTTRHLPEAYFLASALEARKQRVGVVNIAGRTLPAMIRVLRRLRRNRGTPYLTDLLLARTLRRAYLPASVRPFPEIDDAIGDMKRRWSTHSCVDPHRPATLRFVRDFDPDYMLLAGTPVLKPSLFTLARHGTLNRHLGMLPQYKGSDCPLWALAGDDAEHLGFSIHRVVEKVDAGAVLHVEHVPIEPDDGFVGYLARLQRQASEALIGVLERLIAGGPVVARPQLVEGRYFPPAGLSTLRRARRNFESARQRAARTQALQSSAA